MGKEPFLPRTEKNILPVLIPHRDTALQSELMSLWEASVRKTHDFLSETALQSLKPMVLQGICQIHDLFVIKDENTAVLAFMGTAGDKIEMLFVDPRSRGMGIGKTLVFHAIENLGARHVDVNEQNPQAIGFYQHCGFIVTSRSALDDQGNPYPILHMVWGQNRKDQTI